MDCKTLRWAMVRSIMVGAMMCLTAFTALDNANAQENIFKSGGFDKLQENGAPEGWGNLYRTGNYSVGIANEQGNQFLRITNNNDKTSGPSYGTSIELEPEWKYFEMTCIMRAKDLKNGKAVWQRARVVPDFRNEAGERTGDRLPAPTMETDSDSWVRRTVTFSRPADAETMNVTVGMWFTQGQFDVDEIHITPYPSFQAYMDAKAGTIEKSGGFEALDEKGNPIGWKMPADKGFSIVKEGDNHFLRQVTDDVNQQGKVKGIFKIDPDWAEITVTAEMRVFDYKAKPGRAWKQWRVGARFLDGNGKNMKSRGPDFGPRENIAEWEKQKSKRIVPLGAKYVELELGFNGAAGTGEMDNFVFSGIKAGEVADAELPESRTLTWGKEPVMELTDKRGELVLNGLWKFFPALPGMKEPSEKGWGYLNVPGSWNERKAPGFVAKGSGRMWASFQGKNCDRGWYKRTITIPEAWAGRAIVLDLPRVSTDCKVYLDGQLCGTTNWPGGKVNLTKAAKPGTGQELMIDVIAAKKRGQVISFMENATAQVSLKEANLTTRGITGDVILTSQPMGAYVNDVFVQTSTRKKQVTLDVELKDVKKAGPVKFTAEMVGADGKVEKTLTQTTDVKAADTQLVKLTWDWAGAKLWSPQHPNLYTLKLKADGAGLADNYPQEFGFREFWIDGKKFFLNGDEIRLRPINYQAGRWTVPELQANIKTYKEIGFNFGEAWPWDVHRRGIYERQDLMAREASKMGWMISAQALYANSYMMGAGWKRIWNNPGVKEAAFRAAEIQVRRFRNYPAVVMWFNSGNYFGRLGSWDPERIGVKDWADEADERWQKRVENGREGIAFVKSLDPTRPFVMHAGSYVGDVQTSNQYMDMIPLQEREEWLTAYEKQGTVPYMPVEFGAPIWPTMHRGRNGYNAGAPADGSPRYSEPLYSEFSAIYLGNRAYELEEDAYRNVIRKDFKGGLLYGDFHVQRDLHFSAPFQAMLSELFIPNTWRSWRTSGITGGMIPWNMAMGWNTDVRGGWGQGEHMTEFEPGQRGPFLATIKNYRRNCLKPPYTKVTPAGEALMKYNNETLAWIAGVPHHTDKTHNFYGGETVKKQLVLINDMRSAQPYKLSWTATVAGKVVGKGEKSGKLSICENLHLPIEFVAPKGAAKSAGKIALTATIGETEWTDEFAFRVFPKATPAKGSIMVYDPKGITTKMLKEMGYTVHDWNPKAPKGKLLAVGREAIDATGTLPGNLSTFVTKGGRIVIFEQDPDVLSRRLGLRVCPKQTRYVWPVHTNHPAVAGLDHADLTNWAGSPTLVEAKPDLTFKPGIKRGLHDKPWWGAKWGNTHTVSSAAIEKPHNSSWTPILECEFDLQYSPLMELTYGKGLVVLCSLDIEEQYNVDPAARKIAQAIVDYAVTAKVTSKAQKVVALGDTTQLDAIGAIYTKAGSLNTSADVVILGPGATVADGVIKSYVNGGGKVIVLASDGDAPLGVKRTSNKAFNGSIEVPNWPEAAGLSASDLHWRTYGPAVLLESGCDLGAGGQLGRKAIGKGVVIYSQLNPQGLNADEKTYFRFTRWRQTRALSQVLSNLGVSFQMDEKLLQLRGKNEVPLAGKWKAKLVYAHPEPEKWGGDDQFKGGPIRPLTKELLGITAETDKNTDWSKLGIKPELDTTGWDTATVPAEWETYGPAWNGMDGEAIFQKIIDLPVSMRGKDLVLSLGNIHHCDYVYINGQFIGKTGYETKKWWEFKRFYTVPAKVLNPGRNVLTIVIQNDWRDGGFAGGSDEIKLMMKEKPVEYYHPDYRTDFVLGDDPYRFHQW